MLDPRRLLLLAFVLGAPLALAQVLHPTGHFAIGRSRLAFQRDHRSEATVVVEIWYPAVPNTGDSAQYWPRFKDLLRDKTAESQLRQLLGSAFSAVQDETLAVNARENARIVNKPSRLPFLLFSHGLGESPFLYTTQLEELASHGYIVAAVEHLNDCAPVLMPDGHVVPFDNALWDRFPPDAPSSLTFFQARAIRLGNDLSFVLKEFVKLANSPRSMFYKRLDLAKVGTIGHSLGGRAAGSACLLDPMFRACLNEDGTLDDWRRRPYWPISDRHISGEFAMLDWFDPGLDEHDLTAMHMTLPAYARARLHVTGEALAAYQGVVKRSYRISILESGMTHLAFTDQKLLEATLPSARAEALIHLATIRRLVLDFFTAALAHNTHLDCDYAGSDALVQCFTPIQ